MSASTSSRVPETLQAQAEFLPRFNVSGEEFQLSGLKWSDLETIYADYYEWWHYLRPAAQYIANTIQLESGVHAVSQRVKDPEHLVEKIIRRSKKQRSPWATPANYREVVKDMIGVRALHLFKEDWKAVHASVLKHWEPKTPPAAKVRDSDPENVIKEFTEAGCTIEFLNTGYRSVHYDIRVPVAKKMVAIELQVRSLFEEAWGEVSHRVEYPYFQGSAVIEQYLIQLSHLAGIADSLASAAKLLREVDRAAMQGKSPEIQTHLQQEFQDRLRHVAKQSAVLQKLLGDSPQEQPQQDQTD